MKRLRGFLLGIFAICASVLMITAPVFATPDTTTTDDSSEVITDEAIKDTTDETLKEEKEVPTCAEQIGTLAWLVCPGTGLLANIIDSSYNLLTSLMDIDPIPTGSTSPLQSVWRAFRNLTNLAFLIILLICIISQITGFGFSNFNIKRILPRLIVISILANVSYYICGMAVDLSNILGVGVRGFFDKFFASTNFTEGLTEVDTGALLRAFLGLGGSATIASITGLASIGGFSGLIWLIIPIIVSGAISILGALITMVARQSLIYLLVMVSPLAIVAYALPNTEHWAKKWNALFTRLIVFYPMFSFVFGASRFASLTIISTALTNVSKHAESDAIGPAISIIIGIAVQLLPLFLAIPMMRLSGTVLSKVSDITGKITQPALRAANDYSLQRRKHYIELQRSGLGPNPNALHNHLAKYLNQRRHNQMSEIKELQAINIDNNEAGYAESYYRRDGTVSRTGAIHLHRITNQIRTKRIASSIDTDFDEGFLDNDSRVANSGYAHIIRKANTIAGEELIKTEFEKARASVVRRKNIENRATNIRDTLNGFVSDQQQISDMRKTVEDIFHTSSEDGYNTAKSAILASVISQKRKADSEAQSEFFEQLSDNAAGDSIKKALEDAFKEGNSAKAKAAIQVLTDRGDQNWVLEVIEENTRNNEENMFTRVLDESNSTIEQRNAAMRFQKSILDSTLGLKRENVIIAAWAKANMIRRAKHEAGQNIQAFISLQDFMNGTEIEGEDSEETQKLSAKSIIEQYKDGSYFAEQDRTVFKQLTDWRKEGIITTKDHLFKEKDVRSGLASGKMDGETLTNSLNEFTNGFVEIIDLKKLDEKVISREEFNLEDIIKHNNNPEKQAKIDKTLDYFNKHKDEATDWVYEQLQSFNGTQAKGQKSTAVKIYSALLGLFGKEQAGFELYTDTKGDQHAVAKELRTVLEKPINQMKNKSGNGASLRSQANPDVLAMYGIDESSMGDAA